MVKLHLVGFTSDLKSLIFATRKGARSGNHVVPIDARLKRTIEEVLRLESEGRKGGKARVPRPAPTEPTSSKLSPRDIQQLLREGKTEEQVAKLAETDVAWIERFHGPVLAERVQIIEAVRDATISKPRLGPSGHPVGEAVEANLEDKRVRMEGDAYEDAWMAVRRNGIWLVTFAYKSRGAKRVARFSYRPETREVEPLNTVASDIGWRQTTARKPKPKTTARKPKPKTTARKPKPKTTARKPKPKARGTRARRR